MEDKFQGIRFGYEEQDVEDLPSNAATIAADCDAAVVVVGRDKEWETEGQDIPMFELPGQQVRLIQGVSKICKRVIVVVQTGIPVEMTKWIDRVQGDLTETALFFPIGYGLSYTKFALTPIDISTTILRRETRLTLTVRVDNLGGFKGPGRQTVIAWLAPKGITTLQRPKKQVCAFAKSGSLISGESVKVRLEIDVYAFGVFDPEKSLWVVDANTQFDILVGMTAVDITPCWAVEVPEEIIWIHRI
ncbi:hypothetical protein V2G26_007452 [Clonostachys chloroleuca]